jgi:hypothetical protein
MFCEDAHHYWLKSLNIKFCEKIPAKNFAKQINETFSNIKMLVSFIAFISGAELLQFRPIYCDGRTNY